MSERVLRGEPASPGVAGGVARLLDAPAESGRTVPMGEREEERIAVQRALEQAADQLERVAADLRAARRGSEADIVETGILMARDPGLAATAEAAVLRRGRSAPDALIEAAEHHALAIAALGDPTLAARADDVRSLGRRAARCVREADSAPAPANGEDRILIARDLGPADVSELGADVRGIVLAAGAVTAHAAIVARSLGVPMVIGVGEEILAISAGSALVVDGADGSAVVNPAAERRGAAHEAGVRSDAQRERERAQRDLPAVTLDGRRVRVLANVVSPAEVAVALDAGAEGAGLIRTELAFLDAGEWPSEQQHIAALDPVLATLGGQTATVRVLDFGGDKSPPFLETTAKRGLDLLLAHPKALSAQVRAILRTGADTKLRLLLPMVSDPAQVLAFRALACEAVEATESSSMPLLGAMVELPLAAERAAELVAEADFVSIGTNDLTAATLGLDRFAAGAAPAHHPRVLALIAKTLRAARAAGVPVEICGEAASDPVSAPLLVGLGADELSVGAARVGTVRGWVRELEFAAAAELAQRALAQSDAESVEQLNGRLAPALS
jgi:phosphoenolpyruvate-protein kinase (PTS system EI component)